VTPAALLRRVAAPFALAALLCAPLGAADSEPEISVRLAPDPVALDEVATLEIVLSGSGFDSPALDPGFELENLEVVAGPLQAQNFSWVNGRTSSTFQLRWRLRPLGVGRARVGSLRLRVDGREHVLPDQEIAVVEQAPPGRLGAAAPARPVPADPFEELFDTRGLGRRRTAAQQPKILVRAEVEPANPWVGQQIAYRLVLYTQSDISAFNPLGLPDFRGFWAREVNLPDKVRPEWVERDGERYGRVVMLQRALYPLQAGKLTLEPIEVEVVARLAQSGFFGPFAQPISLRKKTEPLTVEARPLPAPPPGFGGVVGDLELTARLDRSETDVGQAATLTVAAESRGNLQGLAAPELELPPGLTAYPPRPETSERVESGALVSKQTWTYVLVPDRAGELEVPSISLAYFDPRAGRYATAGSRALPLSVHAAPPAVPTAPAPAATPAATSADASPAGRPLLWIAGGLAVAALIALGFLAGRRTARADAPPRRRLLAALDAAAREPARTAAEGFDAAWRGYLAERWGVAADTPIAALPDRLRERGVPGDAAAAILALFEEIEYLRQAPELSDVGHLREEVVARSRTLLRELR